MIDELGIEDDLSQVSIYSPPDIVFVDDIHKRGKCMVEAHRGTGATFQFLRIYINPNEAKPLVHRLYDNGFEFEEYPYAIKMVRDPNVIRVQSRPPNPLLQPS